MPLLNKEERADLLESIKEKDKPENAYPLIRQEGLCDFVHAWAVHRTIELDTPEAGEAEVAILPDDRQLWAFVKYDLHKIAFTISQTFMATARLFQKARDLLLIYADGTVAESATKFLSMEIQADLAARKLLIEQAQLPPRGPGRPTSVMSMLGPGMYED